MLLKKIFCFGGGKKTDSEYLSYNLMLNSDILFFIPTRIRNKQPYPPPSCKLNGRSLMKYFQKCHLISFTGLWMIAVGFQSLAFATI